MSLFTRDDIPPPLRAFVPPGTSLTYPPQGMTSQVGFVDGDSPCVIKRCVDPVYLSWLAREERVLRALADASLPIPRLFDYTTVDAGDRHEAWLVMSRLDGRSLWHEMLHADPAGRADLLWRLGALLKTLHATAVPAALAAESPWIDRKLAEAHENLAWCDGTPALLADLHRRRPAPVPEVLIHGDLALDNVLIGPDGALSLIDWSSGDQGDPRCDVSLALQTEPEMTLNDREVAALFDGCATPPVDPITRRWFEDLYEFF